MQFFTLGIILFLFIINLLKLHNKFIMQQIINLVIFLSYLSISTKLDIILPMYFIFSLISILFYIKKLRVFTIIIIMYYMIYLLFGIFFQNPIASVTTFISKQWQFIIILLILDSEIILTKHNLIKIIFISIIFESLIGLFVFYNSNTNNSIDIIRLVAGAQPITGNISIAITPLLIYTYFINRSNFKIGIKIMMLSFLMFFWILISGTRGYMILYFPIYVILNLDFFLFSKNKGYVSVNRFLLFLIGLVMIYFIIIVNPSIIEKLNSIMRVKVSFGIRTYENEIVRNFFKSTDITTKLFGVGIGENGNSIPILREKIFEQYFLGMWNLKHYLFNSGAIFHNMFSNIIVQQGIFGILIIFAISINLVKTVFTSTKKFIKMRILLIMFIILFLIMNVYRWSASCGIAEMIILAFTIRIINDSTILTGEGK